MEEVEREPREPWGAVNVGRLRGLLLQLVG
jgi:hypothetical protein